MTVRTFNRFRARPGLADRFEQAYREGRMLERARSNPGFLRGQLLRAADEPDVFVATAEWRSAEDYAAWQAAYDTLPREALTTMLESLAEPAEATIYETLLDVEADPG